ncbi:hypothetical protein Tco_0091948 [Tanacetum coccineum]
MVMRFAANGCNSNSSCCQSEGSDTGGCVLAFFMIWLYALHHACHRSAIVRLVSVGNALALSSRSLFEDSCAVGDDLRKTYEKCNDISQESRALICTLLKESSKKDRKLHLFMYGKASQLQKQMDAKSAWFQEKYSGLHTEVMIKMSYLVPLIAIVFIVVVGCYLASVPQEEDHQYIVAILGLIMPLIIVAIGVESSSLAVTSSGLSSDVSDDWFTVVAEKVMSSMKNGDDGDMLLFRDGLGACDISNWVAREVGESILLGMEYPVAASCSEELSGTLLESD